MRLPSGLCQVGVRPYMVSRTKGIVHDFIQVKLCLDVIVPDAGVGWSSPGLFGKDERGTHQGHHEEEAT